MSTKHFYKSGIAEAISEERAAAGGARAAAVADGGASCSKFERSISLRLHSCSHVMEFTRKRGRQGGARRHKRARETVTQRRGCGGGGVEKRYVCVCVCVCVCVFVRFYVCMCVCMCMWK